ncbi:uncharacterized protein CTRU02_204927 [Colletotrichum truncatum]|uniref:Uncharacterized protein n=1 Tax=Colletotrichum truncatum TaxID=5467 RepID=A0ACC3Z2J3_COLTU|nr:uncharacterized protein CTRU02_14013 [Colletotrichum truncatum]KAF6782694.1 hypothetical protein CTRU02_14013 [Colletotrichum truncatum]
MAQPNIHSFYRIWFTVIDPLVLVVSAVGCVVSPAALLDGFIPATMSKPDPDHGFLFQQIAALYLFMATIMIGVLRTSSDMKIWRTVQGGVLVVDIALLIIIYVSLDHQARLSPSKLRLQDYGNVLFTGWVAVVRGLFLAGVGVQDVTPKKSN